MSISLKPMPAGTKEIVKTVWSSLFPKYIKSLKTTQSQNQTKE